ncbi:Lcl C-terminal domain-containing protein [Endothiovibrio diazotrophicus]
MKRPESRLWLSAAVTLLCGGAGAAFGADLGPTGTPTAGTPPVPAINACASLSSGASCSFEAPVGTVSGVCSSVQSTLACTPSGGGSTPAGGATPDGGQSQSSPTGSDPLQPLADGSAPSPTGAQSQTGQGPSADGGQGDQPQGPGGTNPPTGDGSQTTADGSGRHPGFRADHNDIYLPEIDAGGYGTFALSLQVVSTNPLVLSLDPSSVQVVDGSGQGGPMFDTQSGGLTIPQVQVGERWYSAELHRMEGGGGFRFQLVNLSETDAPDDVDGSDQGDQGDDGSSDGDPLSTAGVASGYPLVDTHQQTRYGNAGTLSGAAQPGDAFYGQDADYAGNPPSYTDNGDGTVTDNVTGLMWQQTPDFNGDGVIDVDDKMTLGDAIAYAASFNLAGYDDWRLPTIKELYSLMDFSGSTGISDGSYTTLPADADPYLDTDYFDFAYGDTAAGERYIDAQYWSSTVYGSNTMGGNPTAFGVNFADGRIKGYPYGNQAERNGRFVRYVRGNPDYGNNLFSDNDDGTISDQATGLTWLQSDSGAFGSGDNGDGAMNWEQALAWCEGLEYAGHDDWRLPNVKELQSLVDYSRSPDVTNSAAIDPLFDTTLLADGINSSGVANYPYYWSGTTHDDGPSGNYAAYVAFGEARGYFNGSLDDVHGAGAQRSDPKSGDPSGYIGVGHGPQGDVVGIYNYARCVRTSDVATGNNAENY